MSTHDDLYAKESILTSISKRELANGQDKDPVMKLRLHCFAYGATGVLDLSRALRKIDSHGRNSINLQDFSQGIREAKLQLSDSEIKDIFHQIDTHATGYINTTDILAKLRPPMNRRRLGLIEEIFSKMDHSGKGVISIADLKHLYSVNDQWRYQSGEQTKKEIFEIFLDHLTGHGGSQDGMVTKDEFTDYYASVSASIDDDSYFDLLMRRAYQM